MKKTKEYAVILSDRSTKAKLLEWIKPVETKECTTDADILKHLGTITITVNFLIFDHIRMKTPDKVFQAISSSKKYKDKITVIVFLEENQSEEEAKATYKDLCQNLNLFFLSKPLNASKFKDFFTEVKIKITEAPKSTETASSDMKGDIQKYTYIKLLGAGTEGVVSLFKDNHKNRLFAMKTIKYEGMNEKSIKLLKDREIKNMETIKGPTIVEFYENIEDSDCMNINLEFAVGGTLDGLIKQMRSNNDGIYSNEVKLNWAVQILLGIYTLHSHSMVHRDIKPENILLCDNGQEISSKDKHLMVAKLSDLGISKIIEGITENTVTGTPFYAAPEIISNHKYDKDVDLWSFGVLLHELVLLKRPFESIDVSTLFKDIRSGKIKELPESIDHRVRYLIDNLLIRFPNRRLKMNEIMSLEFIQDIINENILRFPRWKEFQLVRDIIQIPSRQCIYQDHYFNAKDFGNLLNCFRLWNGTTAVKFKKSFLGKNLDCFTGNDLLTFLEENVFSDNSSACEDFLQEMLNIGVIVNIANIGEIDRMTETSKSAVKIKGFSDKDKYVLSFDSNVSSVDNPPFGYHDAFNLTCKRIDFHTLVQHVLHTGIKIIDKFFAEDSKEDSELQTSKELLFFLHGVSLFPRFNILSKETLPTVDLRHTFLLNLHQIMLIHNLIKEELKIPATRQLLFCCSKDINIIYKFKDCTLNDQELHYGLFRNNVKPVGSYFKAMSDNDRKMDLRKGVKLSAKDLLVTPEFPLIKDFDSTKYLLQVFDGREIKIEYSRYLVRFAESCLGINEEDELRLAPFLERQIELDHNKNVLPLLEQVASEVTKNSEQSDYLKHPIDNPRVEKFLCDFADNAKKIKRGKIAIVYDLE